MTGVAAVAAFITPPIEEDFDVVTGADARRFGDDPSTARNGLTLLVRRTGETRPAKLPVGVPIPGRANKFKPDNSGFEMAALSAFDAWRAERLDTTPDDLLTRGDVAVVPGGCMKLLWIDADDVAVKVL